MASAFCCASSSTEPEVLGVPGRLAGDLLEDERVDLGQRMVARQVPERVREARVAARVVERVPRLVEEGLVVVEAALRSGDQVHDLRRVRGDDAGARRLLRAVVEVELDARLVREVEAEVRERVHAHLDGAILRVRALERRQPAHVRDVERGRSRLALVAEEPLEPAVAQDRVVAGALVAGLGELGGELAQRDSLLVLVALDRVGDSGEVGRELVLVAQEVAPALVELRGSVGLDVAELVTVAVLGHDRELRLSRTQRHLLALERDALGQDRVLELVLALGELLVGHTALAGEAQPRDPLPLVAVGTCLPRRAARRAARG